MQVKGLRSGVQCSNHMTIDTSPISVVSFVISVLNQQFIATLGQERVAFFVPLAGPIREAEGQVLVA